MRPISVDLFAGAGGLSLGFEQAGFDILAAVEIDPIHCAVHEYNFPKCTIICQSVTEITGKEIRDQSSIGDQTIDVVFGGPPCQGFSLMGKRLLDDPRNQLVSHFIRLVDELKPKYFVMENVKGMAIGKHQNFIAEAIQKLHKSGYQVLEPYQVLNAANYGIPQNRERLFLIGAKKELPCPEYPKPITKPAGLNRKVDPLYAQLPDSPTIDHALQDLPNAEDYPELKQQDWVSAKFKKPSDYVRSLNTFLPGNYSYPREYDPDLLTSSLLTQHTLESIQRFERTPHGKTEPISRFLKLDPHGVCNTLRAGTPSSRGAYTSPRPIHPYVPRCITVREAARLHSYPDWFRFHITKWHGCRQIGNSVPPLLGRSVAAEIIKVLGCNPTIPNTVLPLGDPEVLSLTMTEAAQRYSVPYLLDQ